MKVFAAHSNIRKLIASLDKSTQGKALKLIRVLSVQGKFLSMPFSKKVSKDMYELRITAENNLRIIYAFNRGRIILLHAFVKKSQKLPKKELRIAEERLASLIRYNI